MDEQYTYDEETFVKKFRKITEQEGLGLSSLPVLCDKMGLHLLLNSEDMSYHFKFQEVIHN